MFGSLFNRKATEAQDASTLLQELRASFDQELARLLATALAADATGSPAWDALLEDCGIEPESEVERVKLAQGGFAQRRGAPCPEVRAALERLEESTLSRWRAIDGCFAPDHEETRCHVISRVAAAQEDYVSQVKPPIQMGNVFANALLSSQQHASKAGPQKLSTLRCRTCGSPRSQDAETLCRYCGHSLYECPPGATGDGV